MISVPFATHAGVPIHIHIEGHFHFADDEVLTFRSLTMAIRYLDAVKA